MRNNFWILICFGSLVGILWLSCNRLENPNPSHPALTYADYMALGQQYKTIRYDSALLFFQKALSQLDIPDNWDRDTNLVNSYIEAHHELATGMALKADFAKAHAHVDTLIDFCQPGLLQGCHARSLLAKGRVYMAQFAWKRDEHSLHHARKLIEEASPFCESDPNCQIEKWLALGTWHDLLHQDSVAALYFARVFRQIATAAKPDSILLTEALFGLANTSTDSSGYFHEQILAINQPTVFHANTTVKTFVDHGINFRMYARNQPAFINYVKKADGLFRQIFSDDYYYAVRLNKILGAAYADEGDTDKSMECYEKASLLEQRFKGDPDLGIKTNIANNLKATDPDRAIKLYEEILPLLEPRPGKKITALVNLGEAYERTGQYEKAIDIHQQIIPLKQNMQIGDTMKLKVLSNSNVDLGRAYTRKGDHLTALKYLQKAEQIKKSIGEFFGADLANTYNQMGDVYLRQNEAHLATTAFQLAIEANVPGYIQSANGDEKMGINQLVSADAALFSTFDLLYSLSQKAYAHSRLFQLTNNEKEWMAASDYFDAAMVLLDRIRHSFDSDGSKQALMTQARSTYHNAITHCLHAYETTLRPAFLDDAFRYSEQSKYLLLTEALFEKRAKLKLLPPELLLREDSLKKAIHHLDQQRTTATTQKDALDRQRQLLADKYRQLQLFIEENHPDYHQLNYAKPPGFDNLQQYLHDQPRSAMVAYTLSDSFLIAFAITRDTVVAHRQKLDHRFWEQLHQLRAVIYNKAPATYRSTAWLAEYNQFCEAAHALHDVLLAPLMPTLAHWGNLIVIPDGELGYIPFQVLLTEPADAPDGDYRRLPYLFVDHTIRYEYSSTLLLDNNKYTEFRLPYVGFAPSYQQSSAQAGVTPAVHQAKGAVVRGALTELAFNKEEVVEAYQLFGGMHYTGTDATKANFRKSAPGAAILHLSMHGLVHDKNPLSSHLVFTKYDQEDDNRLFAYELYSGHNLQADLAVLSACNTGYGKLQKGEGILSLSRAFKYAGCPNIVMSLWSANDQSAKDLLTGFFVHLKKGQGKATALEMARRQYFTDPRMADEKMHPFYWAAFVLIGDNEPVTIGITSFPVWWLAVMFVVLLGIGWMWLVIRKKTGSFR